MANAISWTDRTDNVIRGCSRTCAKGSKQSGCGDQTGGGCYAEAMAWRIVLMDRARGVPEGKGKYDGLVRMTPNGPRWTGVVRLDDDDLRKIVNSLGRTPRRRFINSMSDPFHRNLTEYERDQFWAAMLINCRHEHGGNTTFQVLTKRAQEAHDYFTDPRTIGRVARAAGNLMEDGDGWHDTILYSPLGLTDPQIWLGVSIENRAAFEERAPLLRNTPAALRFWSVEPHLGDLGDVSDFLGNERGCGWLIQGAESGPGARSMKVEWARSLRDQCAAARVPYFLKQAFGSPQTFGVGGIRLRNFEDVTAGEGSTLKRDGLIELPYLDGVRHAAFPEVTRG